MPWQAPRGDKEVLLEAIEGKRSEDLATEVLAFVLQSASFRPLQKLFYHWLLSDGESQSTIERAFDITTQATHPGQGRLDLTISGDNLHIIVESKFDAEFSGGDQLHRYFSILRQAKERQRILVLLCPERYRQHYEEHALKQFGVEFGAVTSLAELKTELFQSHTVDFRVLTWDRLLQLLDSDSPLIAELIEFVRNRVLLPVEFSSKELSMMMSDEIPNILTSVFRAVDQVKGRLDAAFVAGRTSQSKEVFGYYVDYQNFRFWFGCSLQRWQRVKTPFTLLFNSQWKAENSRINESLLPGLGFTKDEDYVYPITFADKEPDCVLSLLTQLRQKIMEVVEVAQTRPE
jgi:hypothetical protein